MEVVYFVYATFENRPETPMGVWQRDLPGVCSQFKKDGPRSQVFRNYGDVISIRVVERIWQETEDGKVVIISTNTYNQRDMRRLSNS